MIGNEKMLALAHTVCCSIEVGFWMGLKIKKGIVDRACLSLCKGIWYDNC